LEDFPSLTSVTDAAALLGAGILFQNKEAFDAAPTNTPDSADSAGYPANPMTATNAHRDMMPAYP
jgi:hypothetical protein